MPPVQTGGKSVTGFLQKMLLREKSALFWGGNVSGRRYASGVCSSVASQSRRDARAPRGRGRPRDRRRGVLFAERKATLLPLQSAVGECTSGIVVGGNLHELNEARVDFSYLSFVEKVVFPPVWAGTKNCDH